MEACSPQMYCMHGKRNFKSKQMETRKNEAVCGCWLASVLIRDSVCRHYYVIGLLQPRYVMPNLVAIRLQEKKEEWRKKKPYELL